MSDYVRVCDFYLPRKKPKPRISARDRDRAERERTNKQLREELAADNAPPLMPKNIEPNIYWLRKDERPDQSELPLSENS